MALVRRFEGLEAWQAARSLTSRAYALTGGQTKCFADRSLCDQVRRAAVSTMSNIAEGFDSGSRTEFRRFLRYAARSASEVQSCLYVARDQGYLDQPAFENAYAQAQRVRQLCSGLIRRLGAHGKQPTRSDEIAESPATYLRTPARPHARTGSPPHPRTPARAHARTPAP
jgi:four helix bundle protein